MTQVLSHLNDFVDAATTGKPGDFFWLIEPGGFWLLCQVWGIGTLRLFFSKVFCSLRDVVLVKCLVVPRGIFGFKGKVSWMVSDISPEWFRTSLLSLSLSLCQLLAVGVFPQHCPKYKPVQRDASCSMCHVSPCRLQCVYIYIYIYGVRPVCSLHFGQTNQNFPSFTVKNGPEKKGLKNVPNMHFLFSFNLLLSPEKGLNLDNALLTLKTVVWLLTN